MTRHIPGIVGTVLSIILVVAAAPALVSADTPSGPAAPTALAMSRSASGGSVVQGDWVNARRLDLHFQVQVTAGALTPQVEVEPSGAAFTGEPSFTGAAMTSSGIATIAVSGLASGKTYHWQARVTDSGGNASAWVPFTPSPAGFDFGVDTTAPSRPILGSSTNPDPNKWYNVRAPLVQWSSHDALSGVRGYTFRLLRAPHVIKAGAITPATGARLSNLSDGVWWAAVRSVDKAGNWSPTATFRLQLDRTTPRVWWQGPSHLQYNPYRGSIRVKFKVSKDSSLKLGLWRVGAKQPLRTYVFPSLRAGQTVEVQWNGRDSRGRMAPKGYYYFAADVVDHANNLTHVNVGGIAVTPMAAIRSPAGELIYPDGGKRIIVSLSQETLYAYDGTKLLLRTYVTTGNPSLPTPPGSYSVMARYAPYEFISPWPEGSPYWYPPSWSNYALLFRDGGYFLHDAPWRSAFGPGTNGPGQPGTNYGGTHGCVNIPPSPMVFLWNFAPVGTPVDVVP